MLWAAPPALVPRCRRERGPGRADRPLAGEGSFLPDRSQLRGGLDHPAITGRTPPARIDANDPASQALRDEIERRWRQEVRHWPAKKRREWLDDQATQLVMRARPHLSRLRDCERKRRRLGASVPSATWFDDAFGEGAAFPVPGMRRGVGSVVLELSRTTPAGTPVIDRFAGRRFTPTIARNVEDQLDTMTPLRAQFYRHAASCSAVAIARIRLMKATESRGRRRRLGGRRLVPYEYTIGGDLKGIGFA